MEGDALARGGKSATFPSLSNISQERWDAMWATDGASKPVSEKFKREFKRELKKLAPKPKRKNARVRVKRDQTSKLRRK